MLEYAITFRGYLDGEVGEVLNFWEWFALGYDDPTLHHAMIERMAIL